MSSPREAQLPLLLSISEGLSRGANEMLRVSPQGDAIHPPSCSLAIREAVEEIKWLRGEAEQWRRDRRERIATAALQGLLSHPETQGTAIDFARLSIRYADALIDELAKEPQP